jgi:hypothetical protein
MERRGESSEKDLSLKEFCLKGENFCHALHNDFVYRVWKKPAFHEWGHTLGDKQFASYILNEAKDDESDVFNVKNEIASWNSKHPECVIDDLPMFGRVLDLAFSFHDTGNIADIDQATRKMMMFNDRFHLDGQAEERSVEIARNFFERPENQGYHNLLPLVSHLIRATKFLREGGAAVFDGDLEFVNLVQFSDQIGTAYFDQNPNRLIGLIYEFAADQPQAIFKAQSVRGISHDKREELLLDYCVEAIINFVPARFKQLVPNDEKRKKIVSIMGSEPPSEKDLITMRIKTLFDRSRILNGLEV